LIGCNLPAMAGESRVPIRDDWRLFFRIVPMDAVRELRRAEFPQMGSGVFVDFGGSFPISQSAISRMTEYTTDLLSLYPTADGPSLIDTEILSFQRELLSLLNSDLDHYAVLFGTNTSAVLRYLGFAFPFTAGSKFFYQADNHNSVLGLRKVAVHKGGEIVAVGSFPRSTGSAHSLFAFPPQSNFNGKKYPLQWIRDFQSLPNSHVLVDAAAFLPSNKIDLSLHAPDFVVFSLLKCFGASGGCLLIRRAVLPILAVLGNPPFDRMSVVGARAGLAVRLRFEAALGGDLAAHVARLAEALHAGLKRLVHHNGRPLAVLYPPDFPGIVQQGGTVAFNLFDSNGAPIAHDGIFTAATANRIFLRFGVHCNPGGTYMALGWDPAAIQRATAKHEAACSLTASIMENRHVGSIRISFGFANLPEDVDALLAFFESSLVEKETVAAPPEDSYRLAKVFIHPIKGCRGVEVFRNPYRIVKAGLLFDENWGIADELSTFLDRRRCPALLTLAVAVDEELTAMTVTAPDGRSLRISLTDRPRGTKFTSSTVCHEQIGGEIYGSAVNEWFTDVLGQKAILVRVDPTQMKPFRCFFTASLEAIGSPEIEQLRPHLLFESNAPFSEDRCSPGVRTLGPGLEFSVAKLEISTEALVDLKGGESPEPLHSICTLHPTVGGRVEFGLSLAANFEPSRKDPKELRMDAVLA
jgi:molybdenum cofactor sulfurtransferase